MSTRAVRQLATNSQLTTLVLILCSTATRPCSTDPADHSFLPQLSLGSSSPPSPPNTPPSPSMQSNASFHPNRAPRSPLVVLVVPPRLAWSEDPSRLRLISSFAGKHARRGFASDGLCISLWALKPKSFILSATELCASWLSTNRVAFRFLFYSIPYWQHR
jgi:hypothetical protein